MTDPEPSPFEEATEDLLAAILPVVLERMQRATRRLRACSEEIARDPGFAARHGRGLPELEKVQRDSEKLGWMMGVLASASGEDLLLTRREPFGIALVFELVAESLEKEGHVLEPAPTNLPEVAPDVGAGWRLPWVFGVLLRHAGACIPPGALLEWGLERGQDTLELVFPDAVAATVPGTVELLSDIEDTLPGARPRIMERGFAVEFPAAWLPRPAQPDGAPWAR
ncbi:MAG: hypothetical protein O7A09_08625 [Proteobacteria bacterium]|nr:hypothetical protein [Pseudomonadota bacterium]MCZ6598833.1 hypothetical protein [Planctomycetota bacterium]